jgi:thioredoxin reductase (NADPH)
MHDLIIIGAGPAGLSAAITARARNLDVLMVSNAAAKSKLARAGRIDNYPGLAMTSGQELLEIMTRQALDLGAKLLNERVISALPQADEFFVSLASQVFMARTLILALGQESTKPLPGEMEYLGRGVSYCATCDGMLFRGQKVVLYGLNEEAPNEANFLASIGCQVDYVAPSPAAGLDDAVNSHVGRLTAVNGDQLAVNSVSYQPAEGGPSLKLQCQAVFILRQAIAPSSLFKGLVLEQSHIAVDAKMATSIPGVFAAGDCTGKPLQIAKAVGEGQVAALWAQEYLAK